MLKHLGSHRGGLLSTENAGLNMTKLTRGWFSAWLRAPTPQEKHGFKCLKVGHTLPASAMTIFSQRRIQVEARTSTLTDLPENEINSPKQQDIAWFARLIERNSEVGVPFCCFHLLWVAVVEVVVEKPGGSNLKIWKVAWRH